MEKGTIATFLGPLAEEMGLPIKPNSKKVRMARKIAILVFFMSVLPN
jgi:hypothetical protein